MAASTVRITLTPRQLLAAAAAAVLRFTRWLLYLTFVQYVRVFFLCLIAGAVASVGLAVFSDLPLGHRAAEAMGQTAASICLASGVCYFPHLLTIMAFASFVSLGVVVFICAGVISIYNEDEPDPVVQPAAALFVWHYLSLDESERERLMDIVDRVPADVDLADAIADLRKLPDGDDLIRRIYSDNWPRK